MFPFSLARRGLAFAAVVILLVAAVAACGGGDDGGPGPDNVVMSTFTPVPPDFTPEALRTRSARETAFAATGTAQGETTPTPPAAGTPDASVPAEGSPRATARPGEIRPPDAILRTASGDTLGSLGSSNYLDPETQTGAFFEAPYVPLPGNAVTWVNGATARIDVPNSPYAVASATIELYTYDENVALPTRPDGSTTGEIAFFRQTEPSQQVQINGADLTATADVPPGDYIVSARLTWDAPPVAVGDTGVQEQFTQYVYVIKVE